MTWGGGMGDCAIHSIETINLGAWNDDPQLLAVDDETFRYILKEMNNGKSVVSIDGEPIKIITADSERKEISDYERVGVKDYKLSENRKLLHKKEKDEFEQERKRKATEKERNNIAGRRKKTQVEAEIARIEQKDEQLKVEVFDTIRKQMMKKDEWTTNGSTRSVYEEVRKCLAKMEKLEEELTMDKEEKNEEISS